VTLTFRDTKGSNLTAAEVDENFRDLDGRVTTIEENPPPANNIDDITVSGSQMTITMEDASTFGPFTLPTARWRWREDFADATIYVAEDFFRDPDTGSIYRVLIGHTGAEPFDPDLESGGDPVYELILDASGLGGGGGGGVQGVTTISTVDVDPTLDQAGYLLWLDYWDSAAYEAGLDRIQVDLPKDVTVDFPIGTQLFFLQGGNQMHFFQSSGSIAWPEGFNPYSRTFNSFVTATKIAADEWYIHGDLEPLNPVATLSGTTHTLRHDQIGSYYRCTNVSGCDVTVPLNTTVALPIGTEFHFRQCAAGDVTMVAAGGVTINAKSGSTLSTAEQGSVITIKKVATNEWDLFGDDA
jgi:hypothetical protein